MTEPSPPRPGPPPLQPAPPRDAADADMTDERCSPGRAPTTDAATFADLDQRPLAEHVAIFEAEHTRLADELSTIDQL